ncbi:MAG: tyrosine-type recombinase/integrase [Anaerolineaceae bacterium]|nr:tyrosine-type recombinase/integrase [Anaerolineaceae bacterium]
MFTQDLNFTTGAIKIRNGKGQKDRIVFLGKKARRQVRKYLKKMEVPNGPLWLTHFGTQLTYPGLRQIMRRRAEQASVPVPSLHAFRRIFALTCLRNGMDVFSLQRLMGHADLQVLRRYLAQTEDDLKQTHHRTSPVDFGMD